MKEQIQHLLQTDNYLSGIEIDVVEASKGYVEFSVPLKEGLLRLGDIMNGGAIATIFDAAGGMAVFTLEHGKNQVTTNLNSNFLRPVASGPVKVTAKVIKPGKRLAFVRMELFDANGELCAEATGSWYIM